MEFTPNKIGLVHFIGIGGIGMSGIAKILHLLGYKVQGSDLIENEQTLHLQQLGIPILKGHSPFHVDRVNVIVISTAIPDTNPEIVEANKRSIPIIDRATILAELFKLKSTIGISGSHGKTTTTSLAASLLNNADFDPTILCGGVINSIGSNVQYGQGNWLVAETDESDGTMGKVTAAITVVTNIDAEHLNFYHNDVTQLQKTFGKFINNSPFYGLAILCIDDARIAELVKNKDKMPRRSVTYGFDGSADIQAHNLSFNSQGATFDVYFRQSDQKWRQMTLALHGRHNVQNSLAVIAIAQEFAISETVVRMTFKNFEGVQRRFTKTGFVNGITIIDDYAHHPREINSTLEAARNLLEGKLIAVCQPHRYSRLTDLFQDFVTCFQPADLILLLPVYSAGEALTENCATSILLAESIRKLGQTVHVFDTFEHVTQFFVQDGASNGDMILCMGAGNIHQFAKKLPNLLASPFTS